MARIVEQGSLLSEHMNSESEISGTVRITRVQGYKKIAVLDSGEKLEVHRFCCIGEKDEIHGIRHGAISELNARCKNGNAKLLPSFRFSVPQPDFKSTIVVQEASTEEDIDGYLALAKYHYRSHESFGRRAILVAYLEANEQRYFVGYIEITNTFAGHKARNKLLDAPFSDSSGVEWASWNAAAKAKYLNSIARISRCVVHPEYRGAGIGVALCKAAIEYCRKHWHLAQHKPLFLEITADMLKFVPFAEKAGMSFIGCTSGNLDRVKKDQKYLNKVFDDIASGARAPGTHAVFSQNAKSILQKQRADVERIQKIAKEQQLTVDELLSVYLSAASPEGMSTMAYDLLSSSLRFPKPTYMIGLTRQAEAFLSARLAVCPPELSPSRKNDVEKVSVLRDSISIQNLSIAYTFSTPASGWSNAIREAFGIEKQLVSITGVSNLTVEIKPSEILYVWGPSGSGKTGLLEAICGKREVSSGSISGIELSQIATFSLQFEERPLIDLMLTDDLTFSLFCLNSAGLSEAALYLKTPSMLSTGQRHRLAFARLIATRAPIWVIDEFCSVLDDMTATIVARNVRRIARLVGATAIIAGPRFEPVVSALAADKILKLNSLGTWSVSNGETKNEGF